MESTKLISVRVPVGVLVAIDEACDNISWRKRSDYINAALRLIVEAEKKGLSLDVLRFRPEFGDVVDEFSFKYHRIKP